MRIGDLRKEPGSLGIIALPRIWVKVIWDALRLLRDLSEGLRISRQPEPLLIDWGFGEAPEEFVQLEKAVWGV